MVPQASYHKNSPRSSLHGMQELRRLFLWLMPAVWRLAPPAAEQP